MWVRNQRVVLRGGRLLRSVFAAFIALLLSLVGGRLHADPPSAPPPVFAVLADIQYGDKETVGARHFRPALRKLEECVTDLAGRDLAFVIQLGDLVDGYENDPARSAADLDVVLRVLGRAEAPIYHVVGNHCLRVDQATLRQRLGLQRFYYDFTVPAAAGWRFVVLDGNDAGYGMVSEPQLEWFRALLDEAAARGERVICFCHFALLKEAAPHHRMAKPEPLLEALDESGCVVAWFAGHDHGGGYAVRNGVHHLTLKGMVEAPNENAYAFVEIHPDQLKLIGVGKEPGRPYLNLGAHPMPNGVKAERWRAEK